MKIFSIQRKFDVINKVQIIEHRRILTPLIYINLDPKYYIFIPIKWIHKNDIRVCIEYGWVETKKGENYGISKKINIELKNIISNFNKLQKSNVVNLR